MHTGPMKDSDGDFSEWAMAKSACRYCGARNDVGEPKLWVRTWDSHCGGYTDYKYKCDACKKTWWVEGDDG